MVKVVINKCYGGFSISKEATEFMAKRGNELAKKELDDESDDWYGYEFSGDKHRTDHDLISAVETLGEKANGRHAKLVVVEVPDDVNWEIEDHDGWETIEEVHRSWG